MIFANTHACSQVNELNDMLRVCAADDLPECPYESLWGDIYIILQREHVLFGVYQSLWGDIYIILQREHVLFGV